MRFEHLYVMFDPSCFWIAKIGISKDAEIRSTQVEKSIKKKKGRINTDVVCILKMPVLFAESIEGVLHAFLRSFSIGLFYGQSDAMRNTNGGTEWFKYSNPVSALLFLAVCALWFNNQYFAWAIGVFLLPIPLDFCIFVLGCAVLQYAVILMGLYVGFSFLTK